MHRESGLSRRGFIGATATGSAAVMAGPAVQAAAAHELPRRERENLVPRQNIGIQLYSLRDMAGADLPATFDMLEDIGYPEVELFQLHGRTAAELRALLDARGLCAIGAHVGIDRWRNELETVLDEAEALGMPYVGVPGIFPPPPPEVSEWRSLARELNRYGEAAADRGLRFYYHNHDFEFQRAGGQVLYDLMLDRTDPDLVFFELDIYWIVTAGRDPLDYLGRYDQSRWPLFHVKDRSAAPRRRRAATSPTSGTGSSTSRGSSGSCRTSTTTTSWWSATRRPNPRRTARVGYQYLVDVTGRRRRRPYAPREARGTDDAFATRRRS